MKTDFDESEALLLAGIHTGRSDAFSRRGKTMINSTSN